MESLFIQFQKIDVQGHIFKWAQFDNKVQNLT